MARSSNKDGQQAQATPTVSIRVPPGQSQALMNAIERIEAHYRPLLNAWAMLTPAQRETLLEHSPILARLKALADRLKEG